NSRWLEKRVVFSMVLCGGYTMMCWWLWLMWVVAVRKRTEQLSEKGKREEHAVAREGG
ncbi:unnamed protein product, partial [Ilex paraguariensis]